MIRTYFKAAFRNLIRQKITSITTIFCMAIAISCSLIAYLFISNALDNERVHENASSIFLINHLAVEEGDVITYGHTPLPLGPALLKDYSFIKNAVRITDAPATIEAGNTKIEEWIRFADPSFFEMFTFPLASGDPSSLYQKNTVILSYETAVRFFGTQDPIGNTLEIEFEDNDRDIFTVTGVAKKTYGRNSCVQFGILLSYENALRKNNQALNEWNHFTSATFIQVDIPERIRDLSARMEPYVTLQNAANNGPSTVKGYVFQNLLEVSKNRVQNSIAGNISWAPVIVLSSISIFLLLLACFNTINLNLASAGLRLKEIGIRKVIGGSKTQLVSQFLIENATISLVSIFIAIALTNSLLLPAFEEIAGAGLILNLGSRVDLWLYLMLLFVGVAVCSGLYPALYISSFRPVIILRDRFKLGGKNNFTRTLLTIQFILAFITIITSVGLTLNYYELSHRDWGYKKENLLALQVENESQYNLMKKAASEQPGIIKLTGARRHVGFHSLETTAGVGDTKTNALVFEVAPDYFGVMGFKLLSGKFPQLPDGIVVNEKFISRFGWANGMGETVSIDGTQYTIKAIIQDFHHDHFMREIDPVVIILGKSEDFTFLVMEIAPGTEINVTSALETIWSRQFPTTPFNLRFQEESFSVMYTESKGILRVFIFTTVIAVFMSCLGLFGLAAQRIQAKEKEICIRKIFGVPLVKAVLLVNGNFLVLITVAAALASPVSYLLLNALLDSVYLYRMNVNGAPFLISYVLMGCTILITLSEKIYQIARTNPAALLRSE